MSDIIKLLSDSIANQIAAGEVIQRPASVVKELIENSIDAEATEIQIIIKDAGRTLIQIIDNGKGMSPTDARISFERHATSKISKIDDIFSIRTMGFRGEALASIAAIASVELKTRTKNDNIGTSILLSGSKVIEQSSVACSEGTNISVKNLFFNVPARRKFLKTDRTENKNILYEIQKTALANPEIAFQLVVNDNVELKLNSENIKQRIVNICGKNINQHLVNIKSETSIINISGFIAKPQYAQNTNGDQYFFVNKRYMLHPYFRKSVTMAYDKLIPEGKFPAFFIYFDINPALIDVNIHPTKTEIKFEDEHAIFQILYSVVKEALGKFNIVPSMDFTENITLNTHLTPSTVIKPPVININPDYNPFEQEYSKDLNYKYKNTKKPPQNWQVLFPETDKITKTSNIAQIKIFENTEDNIAQTNTIFFQLKNKFVFTSSKSGLIVFNQKRALERIMFEHFFKNLETRRGIIQKSLFPITYEPNSTDRACLLEVISELNSIGFEILAVGKDKFEIRGFPGDLNTDLDPLTIIEEIVNTIKDLSGNANFVLNEKIALTLAKVTSTQFNKTLSEKEMEDLFFKLMSCSNHNYTVEGKKIMDIINIEDIENKLN